MQGPTVKRSRSSRGDEWLDDCISAALYSGGMPSAARRATARERLLRAVEQAQAAPDQAAPRAWLRLSLKPLLAAARAFAAFWLVDDQACCRAHHGATSLREAQRVRHISYREFALTV